MGNFGCCQNSAIVAEENQTEPMQNPVKPEENKEIIELEEKKQTEPKPKKKNKKKVKSKKKDRTSVSSVKIFKKDSESNQFKFDRGGFVQIKKGKVESAYTIVSALGKGSFGCVYKAMHKLSNTFRSVKVLKKENLSQELHTKLLQEVEILKSLDHPNILKIFEVFEDDSSINIITELCTGGELFDRIVAAKTFSENKAALYMYQIMSAVLACHEKNIVHRDLKPENILFITDSEDSALKVIDFGTSKKMEANTALTSLTGTVIFT